MDPILQTLLGWQFITFGLGISAIVFVIRKLVEYLMETYTNLSKEAKLWNDFILPVLPIALGGFLGWLIKTFPYPDGLSTNGSRIIWALGAGLLSGLLYRVVKSVLIQKINGITNIVTDNSSPNNNVAKPGGPNVSS